MMLSKTDDMPLTERLLRHGYMIIQRCDFRAAFMPSHFTVLLRLAYEAERPADRWLNPSAISETCFISERHSRQVLSQLKEWGLVQVRNAKVRTGFEYHISREGLADAYASVIYQEAPVKKQSPARVEDIDMSNLSEEML